MAINKVRKLARKRKAKKRTPVERPAQGQEKSPLEIVSTRDLLNELLKRLPENLRSVFTGWANGLSFAEMAAERGINEEALRKQFRRALNEIRNQLRPENLDP